MPQFIPFVQFSAPVISKRPSYGRHLLESLTSAVVGGAASIAATKIGTDIRANAQKENVRYTLQKQEEQDIARNYVPWDQSIQDRADAENLSLAARVVGDQRYISRSDLDSLEARELDREMKREPVKLPGTDVSLPREEMVAGIQTGTVQRVIPAQPAAVQATADKIRAENQALRQVGQPPQHVELLRRLESGEPIMMSELAPIDQAAAFTYASLMASEQEHRIQTQFNMGYNRDLLADAAKVMLNYDLVSKDGTIRNLISPAEATTLLESGPEAQKMFERGWHLEPKKTPISFGEYITNFITDPAAEPKRQWAVKILKKAGLTTLPGSNKKLDDQEVGALLNSDTGDARIWVGALTLTSMYSPLVGGWTALKAAYRQGTLPAEAYASPAMIGVAAQIYQEIYDQPVDPAEIRALIGGQTIAEPQNIPGGLKTDPFSGDIVDASGETVAKNDAGPSAFRLFGTALNVAQPLTAVPAQAELAKQFGLIPGEGAGLPLTGEQAAAVRERQQFTRYQGMDDPAYSATTNTFLDLITNNPADTTAIFGQIVSWQHNPDLFKDYLKQSIMKRTDIGPAERQELIRSIDALDANTPEGKAVLADALEGMFSAYSQALDIHNNRVEQAQQK